MADIILQVRQAEQQLEDSILLGGLVAIRMRSQPHCGMPGVREQPIDSLPVKRLGTLAPIERLQGAVESLFEEMVQAEGICT